MTNRYPMPVEYSIHFDNEYSIERTCPVCGDDFMGARYMVCDVDNIPLCLMCAWAQSPPLASLLGVAMAADYHVDGRLPADVYAALERRRNDPKRLKKELQKDHDSISSDGPLGEFLKEQLKAALDGKNVEKLKKAKLLFEETKRGISTYPYSSEYQSDLDAEIPF